MDKFLRGFKDLSNMQFLTLLLVSPQRMNLKKRMFKKENIYNTKHLLHEE